MKKDFTHLTLVIDTSGSMISIKNDAEGGINSLINDQKNQEGKCELSIFEFSNDVRNSVSNKSIKDVGEIKIKPNGSTALLDAIGTAINETGRYLESLSENERPSLVIVAIVTDGEENSSREFNNTKIKEMIKLQKDVYNWQFNFLCTQESVLDKACELGFDPGAAMVYNQSRSGEAFKSTSGNISRMRAASCQSLPVENYYNQEERESVK